MSKGIKVGLSYAWGCDVTLTQRQRGGWYFNVHFPDGSMAEWAHWAPRPGNRTLRRELRRRFPMRTRSIATREETP